MLETEHASIPAACCDIAQVAVLDTVGCVLSAINEPIRGIPLLRDGDPSTVAGPATVLGSPSPTSAADATQTNAALAHGLDLDDFDRLGHMSAISCSESGSVEMSFPFNFGSARSCRW